MAMADCIHFSLLLRIIEPTPSKDANLLKFTGPAQTVARKVAARQAPNSNRSMSESSSDDENQTFDLVPAIETEFKSLKKAARNAKKRKRQILDDYGDSNALEAVDAEDKKARKKTLRHYASKI